MGEVELGFTTWEREHLCDPPDWAEAFVTLDGHEAVACEHCNKLLELCRCCTFCGEMERCRCEPISQRGYRAMYARHGLAGERYRP